MTSELLFRTEDMRASEVLSYFVESDTDRIVVDHLKTRSPVILRGSRGVGKSFLLRVAEAELRQSFSTGGVLPVYLTFARASLIRNPTGERFLHWMISKICNKLVRAARNEGLTLPRASSIRSIGGGGGGSESRLEEVERAYEESWRFEQATSVDTDVPGPEVLQEAVEDLCDATGIKRVVLFIDEAAHVFLPDQQRQFFTLMRDLRSPYISVKAAVYPGATSYGDMFQPNHDATTVNVDRTVTEENYASAMREMALKQDNSLARSIEQNGNVFDTLAFAATGNPRTLLKTLSRTVPLNNRKASDLIKGYYREEIWSEHSSLAERYPGHRPLIDWGRRFIEDSVLPDLYHRNQAGGRATSSYLWIHRDAPQTVREALRLLCYSGILQEGVSGVRATRSAVGTRYMVNLGCQFALDSDPIKFGTSVRQALSIKRMTEYGANHPQYKSLKRFSLDEIDLSGNLALDARLAASINALDLTSFQKGKLVELEFSTIGEVLKADEAAFQKAKWVGPVRARQMQNAAVAAVLEYLSG